MLEPHVASPDLHAMPRERQIRLYYHGLTTNGTQRTRVAISEDGLHFVARAVTLGPSYMRVFRYGGYFYGIAMPGMFLRSRDGLSEFEGGPTLFPPEFRHCAVWLAADQLYVFWTRVGDQPERILLTVITLGDDWTAWRASTEVEVLRPEQDWEGADLPQEPSRRGAALLPANHLRDPAVFEEHGALYLLYSVAGERGIGIAELRLRNDWVPAST